MSLPHGGSPAESQPTRKKGTKRRREPVEEEDDLLVDIMPELKAGRFSNDDGPDPLLPVPPGIAGGRAAVQSASYAVEVLSDTYGTRTSCFGTVVKDDKLTIQKLLDKVGKESGTSVSVKAMHRFKVGEGIEKRADDFAAEVAKMAGTG